MEYYDRTLYELTTEIEGYNRRWEERWMHTRDIVAIIYNANAPKGKTKSARELYPLPGDPKRFASADRIKRLRGEAEFEHALKGEANGGSGIKG